MQFNMVDRFRLFYGSCEKSQSLSDYEGDTCNSHMGLTHIFPECLTLRKSLRLRACIRKIRSRLRDLIPSTIFADLSGKSPSHGLDSLRKPRRRYRREIILSSR